MSASGTDAAEWDKNTWPELDRLAREVPEAGVHYQGLAIEKEKSLGCPFTFFLPHLSPAKQRGNSFAVAMWEIQVRGFFPDVKNEWADVSAAADMVIYNRAKDAGSTTALWAGEKLSTQPWFKDVLPNVKPTLPSYNQVRYEEDRAEAFPPIPYPSHPFIFFLFALYDLEKKRNLFWRRLPSVIICLCFPLFLMVNH